MGVVVTLMAVVMAIAFIHYIIHAADRAGARLIAATAGAMHRANISRGVFRTRLIYRFCSLHCIFSVAVTMTV